MDPLAIVRAVATLGEAVVVGSGVLIWFSRDALVPAGASIWRSRVAFSVLAASLIGAVAIWGGAIGAAAAAAGTSPFSINGQVLASFLFNTGVGHITILEIGCAMAACAPAVVAWATLKNPSASDTALLAAAALAGISLATFPFNSHPVTLDQQAAGLLASIAHRIALAVWLGGLPALILLIGAGPVADDSRLLAAVVLRRFSRLATVAMGVILATGVLLTWFLVGNFPGIIGTEYGRLLLLKLAFLAGVLVIAGGLQRHLLPLLELKPSDEGFRSYANRVKIESVLAVLIVVVASDMAGLPPPAHENIVWPLPFRFSFAATWVQAYPDTYLTTDIPFSTASVAAGLRHYEENCTACHGVSGHGNGPLAASMPVDKKPADLSAPHTALHTAGDLYWWITHGISGTAMPGFGDVLNDDDRWDIINFLGAFAVGYQARSIEPKVFPNQYWLGPPDFQITDESGKTLLLSDYQLKSAFLLVIFSCSENNIDHEKARFEQLLSAKGQLEALGAKIILVAPGKVCDSLREQAAGRILLADHDPEDVAATYGLYTRSFHNRKMDVVRVPEAHVEFLIDRSGYIRARWLPEEDNSWSDLGFVEAQLEILSREPTHPPPPDIHSQH